MNISFLKNIVSNIEQTAISPLNYVLIFCSIIFVRFFLESFSNKSDTSVLNTDPLMLLHYTFFFSTAFFFIALILKITSKKRVGEILNISLVGFFIIWLPPLVDLCISAGEGMRMAYLFRTPTELLQEFLTIGATGQGYGVTAGIRMEIIIILSISYLYVLSSTKNHLRSILAIGSIYCGLFLLASIPSFMGIVGNNVLMETLALTKNSFLEYNLIHTGTTSLSLQSTMEYFFNHIMLQTLYLLLLPILILFSYLHNKNSLFAFLANSRPERIAHYFILLTIGISLAHQNFSTLSTLDNWMNLASVITLYLSIYFLWMFSVGMNDIADIDSDKISNLTRPLVTGSLKVEELRFFSIVSLILALIGGYIVNKYALFLIITSIAISYLYSIPPMRLKRAFLINSFLISFAALLVVMIGFYAFSPDPRVSAFPLSWSLSILAFYFLLSHVKDIKDIRGDEAVSVYTIPVVLGEKRGKLLISLFVIIGLALVPIVTGYETLWYLFPLFSILVYIFINLVEKYKDKDLFYLYIAYILAGSILVFFL